MPPSPTGSTAIRSVAITHVLQHDNRYYYRIDALRDQAQVLRKKTYQDFYNLHINLLVLNTTLQLPKLLQLIRQQTKALLLIRCNELNVYLNKLFSQSGVPPVRRVEPVDGGDAAVDDGDHERRRHKPDPIA